MPTQRPLRELLPDILAHIRRHTDYLRYNNRLMLVHEGQLREEIENSMRAELSAASYAKAIKRVPSINLLVRIIDKLSRVYSEPVLRSTEKDQDAELLDFYTDETCLNEKMASANRLLNLHKCVAIEPFIHNGKPRVRVVPAHQFLVYSDDTKDPTSPTVYIKVMGRERKNEPFTDWNGRKFERDEVREVDVYVLYSDDEILIVDSEGALREDKMYAIQLTGQNPLGVIPAVYVNRSDFRLVPVPDTDTLENTILIPKLLADLNYAVQFQSHTVLVALDLVMPANPVLAPDTVWEMTSKDEGKQGRMDTIKPSVDIEQVLMLIQSTLAIWLESRNIKAGTFGQIQPANAASGIAKLIDEADATQDRKAQCGRFHDAEVALWALLAKMHRFWVETGELETEKKLFSEDFAVSIRFPDQKPIMTDKDKIEEVRLMTEAGLMTRRQGIQKLYPYFTEKEITKWMDELEKEKTENAAQVQQSQGTDGQASKGNNGQESAPSNRGTDSSENPGEDASGKRSEDGGGE